MFGRRDLLTLTLLAATAIGMGAATAILLALSTLIFQMGLRRYSSASS